MRNEFREQIVRIIGTDLNGYVLDDAAIDYLEQTDLGKVESQQRARRGGYQEDYRFDRQGGNSSQLHCPRKRKNDSQAGRRSSRSDPLS